MTERTPVINMSGDHEETVIRLAKHLGRNKLRRKVFNAIYGRGTKPRSKKQIMQAAGIRDRYGQQAQNALDHLSKHHLIVRRDNDGLAKDRSRYLYEKDLSVRANRAEIVKYADNPRAAERVPTKRNPHLSGLVPVKIITRQILRQKKHLHVLYLTANPDQAHHLHVDAEVRRVQEAVRGSVYRDNIALEYRPAADLDSLIDGLNDLRPRIVHFSGHGYENGIVVDDPAARKGLAKVVSFDLLAKAFAATDEPPDIVVLNSCKSAGAQKAFLPPAKAIIVMRKSISDVAATSFAVKFYGAIAAGQSLKSAFAQGRVAIESCSLNEGDTPDLIPATGVDPAKLVLT